MNMELRCSVVQNRWIETLLDLYPSFIRPPDLLLIQPPGHPVILHPGLPHSHPDARANRQYKIQGNKT